MNDTSHIPIAAVIMAGGAGTRFWPVSTEERPKQFLRLFGDRSLLQMSRDRLEGIAPPEHLLVLTGERYVPLVREQLPDIPAENVIGEPVRRDTAAAAALAALMVEKRMGDAVILTVTADHLIEPVGMFRDTALSAVREAWKGGMLYTFGIAPDRPATGYGYLECGGEVLDDYGVRHREVLSFREKPDAVTAAAYLGSGRHLWNSGMFVWRASAFTDLLKGLAPDHHRLIAAAVSRDGTDGFAQALAEAFEPLDTVSVDYAVMEKAPRVRCAEARFRWSDVGGWAALRDLMDRDANGNAASCTLHSLDTSNTLVFSTDPAETVIAIGLDDLVIVRDGGRTLVTRGNRAEDVKRILRGGES